MSDPTGALSPALLASLPAHLSNHLSSWPALAALPLNNPQLLDRSGALGRLQEMEKLVIAQLNAMQQARADAQLMATAPHAAASIPPQQQQAAHIYVALANVLQQVQIKSRAVEHALQQGTPVAAANFLDDEEPGQQRQQSNVDMGDGPTHSAQQAQAYSAQAQQQQAHVTQPHHLPGQQHLGQHYSHIFQQQAAAPAQSAHTTAQPNPAIAAAAASSALTSAVGAAAAPGAEAAAPALMHWILPPERRKLPGTRYQKIRTLRKTLFGKVSLYFDTALQKRVAIKLSDKQLLLSGRTTTGNQVAENPLEELRFLRMLSRQNEADSAGGTAQQQQQFIHPGQNHVLQLLDECEDERDLWTVLEFCGKGEFFDIVCAATRFDEPRARMYFIQLAQGVAYLHAHLICHLDLSLENMLMDDQDVCKICDFGLARMMTLDHNRHLVAYPGIKKNKPGKMGYMSPELFGGHSFYGHLCDVWAMGIILFISLTGVPPYQLPALSDQRFKLIYEGQLGKLLAAWGMTDIMSPAAKDIISRMLCPPERRMNIQQILAHEFVVGTRQ